MATNILVCDDERIGFEQVEDALGKGHQIKGLVGAELKKGIEMLLEEVSRMLSGEDDSGNEEVSHAIHDVFGCVDVAIIDNNLSALKIRGARYTAEALIRYFRAFTNVAYIISLNKNSDIDFDLRYLTGDYQSHADLALNTEHLSNHVLWRDHLDEADIRSDPFAPSYWPNLDRVSDLRLELVRNIERRLDRPVLDVLGLRDRLPLEMLSRRAKWVLSPHAMGDSELRDITCLQFFSTSCRSWTPEDRSILLKKASTNSVAAGAIARTVAADLEKWIRRRILAPQDVLVDLPHLLARMPFLLGRAAADLNRWNDAILGTEEPYGIVPEIYREFIAPAKFDNPGMYLRWPCFRWYDLRDDDELNRLFLENGDDWADVVFCEDVSQFRARAGNRVDRNEEHPKEFDAEFGGAWSRRYIRDLPQRRYSPRSWLAL